VTSNLTSASALPAVQIVGAAALPFTLHEKSAASFRPPRWKIGKGS